MTSRREFIGLTAAALAAGPLAGLAAGPGSGVARAAPSKPGSGLVNQGNVSVVAGAQSCFSFLPTSGGMARLSRPRAIVCKFPTHINYSVTRVSAT